MVPTGFGKMMREFRKEHHMTQRELAEKMDISANHVSVLEREEKLPRTSTIEALMALMTTDDLKRRMINEKIPENEIGEYVKLLQSLEQLDEKKRAEIMRIFVQLLALI